MQVQRGGMALDDVFVVRSIPDTSYFTKQAHIEPHSVPLTIGYVGVMGEQDGVDLLIRAVARLKAQGRTDFRCLIVGDGDQLGALKRLAAELNIADRVEFTGFLTGDALLNAYSTFDIGVIPDPVNPYNDMISMNKVFEYMAMGVPFTVFDLAESRAAAGEAALVIAPCDPHALADGLKRLLDDPGLRAEMARAARDRFAQRFSWAAEKTRLLAAYDAALAKGSRKRYRRAPKK